MGLRQALLEAGLGWSMMPRARVDEAICAGRLVTLDVARFVHAPPVTLRAVYRQDRPPGLAGQWLLDALLVEGEGG
jgi:DNA-binding transcriptional LysR family regulator